MFLRIFPLAVVAALLLATATSELVTVDLFDGPDCNETDFFRRDTAQQGICFWQQQDGPSKWECLADGSMRRWICPNCSVACTAENGANENIRYYPGCINIQAGLYGLRQQSYRVTCGSVPEVPGPHNETLGVVYKTYDISNTACDDSIEAGTLHSAHWYRDGYCQHHGGRSRIHTCDLGFPQLRQYDPSVDGCINGIQNVTLSQVCGTQFQNQRFWKCGYAHFDYIVPLIAQNATTSSVVEVAKPQYLWYGTVDTFYGSECGSGQAFDRYTRRIDYCDSYPNWSTKYVCTDFGLREYTYASNTSCTGRYTFREYSSVRSNTRTHDENRALLDSDLKALIFHFPQTCSPLNYNRVQFSIRGFCSMAPAAPVGAIPGITRYHYSTNNTICNLSSAQEPQFDYATYYRGGCLMPAVQTGYVVNATHFVAHYFNTSATNCDDLSFMIASWTEPLNGCAPETRSNGFTHNIRNVYGAPDMFAQLEVAPSAPPSAAPIASPTTAPQATPSAAPSQSSPVSTPIKAPSAAPSVRTPSQTSISSSLALSFSLIAIILLPGLFV